jgi:threonine synthase
VCSGCGCSPPKNEPFPFRCINAGSGDDIDHVIASVLDPAEASWPEGTESNPFVRYRGLLWPYHLATTNGMTDGEFVDLVERLDKKIAAVDGGGFTVTPFARAKGSSDGVSPLGQSIVWLKDETENVSGSHKARHLMGLAIHMEVVEQLGLVGRGERPLAIASCGNAAVAAAVVARAADRTLEVFVPTWADQAIVQCLERLQAHLNVIPREEGAAGDPTYRALQRAIAGGAIPFTCQGPENGLTIDGGKTLAYEIVSQLRVVGTQLESIFIQVGGGALASAVIQGLREAAALGALDRMPQLFTVQTQGGYPLKRAYDRVRARAQTEGDQAALAYAAVHRSEFMWPWEEEPTSVATGILDDETYDWHEVVRGLLETGGSTIVVSEELLKEANRIGRSTTGIDVDHTGTAGLAGLLEAGPPEGEHVGVLFTGKRRQG